MSFASLLDKTCTTQRPTSTRGALGTALTYAENLTGVACRLQQASAKELGTPAEGLSNLAVQHSLWVEIDTDIVATDRVVIDGVTYEVVGVDPDVAGAGHHMQLALLEVR